MNMYYQKKYKRYRDKKHRRDKGRRDICPVCNKPINKLITAIIHKETGKKAHFDCVLKELKKFYQVKPKEEVYYIGGGSFGIIEGLKGPNGKGFVIKKRIQYEEK